MKDPNAYNLLWISPTGELLEAKRMHSSYYKFKGDPKIYHSPKLKKMGYLPHESNKNKRIVAQRSDWREHS